jgi:hypothetical protein
LHSFRDLSLPLFGLVNERVEVSFDPDSFGSPDFFLY